MLIDFVGSFAAGFGLMGLVMLVNRLILRGYFGRWIYPATVAAGMVLYTIWAEYTWPSRTIAAQPQLVLASQNGEAVFYRPWTFIFPQTTRMIAVDRSQTRTHAEQPNLVMTRVILIGRWQPTRGVLVVFDCEAHARADLREGVDLNADGSLEGAIWIPLEADDAVLTTACTTAREEGDGRGNGT